MAFDMNRILSAKPPQGLPCRPRKLGHTVFFVTDLERSVDFYTRILGFEVSEAYEEEMIPGGFVFLRCNADHHCLALCGNAKGPSERKETHHTAFEVATLDELVRFRDHLKENGVEIVIDGRRRAGCQIAVEFLDPDGHHLEYYWGLDQVGSDGRVRPRSEWRPANSLEEAIDNPPPGQDTTLFD